MKKLTLSVGLLMGVMSMKAQDTTCTYFKGERVIEFDYYMDTILYEKVHDSKYYTINVKFRDVLCLDFSDEKNRTRKVITTFFDGSTKEYILDSKNDVYYSPFGTIKVLVGKPKLLNKL